MRALQQRRNSAISKCLVKGESIFEAICDGSLHVFISAKKGYDLEHENANCYITTFLDISGC